MTTVFLVLVGLLFVYEGVALANDYPGDTISELMWKGSRRPLLPFAMGFLMGHFFFR